MDLLGITSVADLLKDGIDKIWPDPAKKAEAEAAILQAQNSGLFKEMDQQFQLNLSQIQANAAAEAKPGITFRDGAGWTCVAGFALTALKSPIEWGCALAGHPITLPSVDTSTTIPMLLGLLGLGGMHMNEQIKGTK
jgi:hypothetical protein